MYKMAYCRILNRPRTVQHGKVGYYSVFVSVARAVVLPFDLLEPHVEFYVEFSMYKLTERSAQHRNVDGEGGLIICPFSRI